MMRVYRCTIETNYHGREMGRWSHLVVKYEDNAKNYVVSLNWDNVVEHWKRLGGALPFSIWTGEKGRIIEWHRPTYWDTVKDWRCRNIKEWKRPHMSITVKVSYEPI